MLSIIAGNANIEKEIRNLLEILMGAGCGFHSNLVIRETDGGLSLETAGSMPADKEIIRLPRTVLMPSDQYMLEVVGDNFLVAYPEDTIATDLQRRVIDKMYEIYNLTDKIKIHKQYSFLFSLIDSPELIEKLGEGREFIMGPYAEWVSWIKAGMTPTQYNKVIYETYVKTRPLGYSDPVRESSVSMIMPVLDFMNHHWEGGAFAVSQAGMRRGDLIMHNSQPIAGSLECYANYGVMDGFDTLIRYDFIDTRAPIIRSVAMELEGLKGDKIKVQNKLSFTYSKELDPQMLDLRRYIPDISFQDDQMAVSHLLMPIEGSKFALVRVLNLMLAAYSKHHAMNIPAPEAEAWKIKAQEQLVEQNKAWYHGLLKFIEAMPADKRGSFGVQRIKEMADFQLTQLDKYVVQKSSVALAS